MESKIYHLDCVTGMQTLDDGIADVILCDPPYNIGKDFGNNSDRQKMKEYLDWCEKWMKECLRLLQPNGTMYVYGFSEILAQVQCRLPEEVNVRWLIWHYTNKNVPSLKFWQRSHESILCIWKGSRFPHFNIDDVREPYTDTFLKNAAGKTRKATEGRFSKGDKTTEYKAHEKGALPRDVLRIPALAGGAGKKERYSLNNIVHPTQKPLELCEKLIQAAVPKEKSIIIVPFVGSGSECFAAAKLGHTYIGYEINENYVKLAQERLQTTLPRIKEEEEGP
jgi:site-specific DNA-methyltransferase (adenine-specific)